MISKQTSYYKFNFYKNFVIVEAMENAVINSEIIDESLKIIYDHYKGQNFTLISHRKNNYTIDIKAYELDRMKKLKAIAVVSPFPTVKEKAMAEQLAFNDSFAFFENLDDAIGWAENVINP